MPNNVKEIKDLPSSQDVDKDWPKEGRDYTEINGKWYWKHEKVPMGEIRKEGLLRMQKREEAKREGKAAGGGKRASILNKDYTSGKDREEYVVGALVKGASKLGKNLKKHYDDLTTEPSPGQKKVKKATEGQRAARGKERSGILKGAVGFGLLSEGASLAWKKENEDSPKTEKEATAFEKAFSKAHNAGEETFMFKGKKYTTEVRKGKAKGGGFPDLTGDGKVTRADVLKGRGVFTEGGDVDAFRMMYEAFKKEMAAAKNAEEKAMIQERFQEQTQNVDEETKREVYKSMDRKREADGGSMLVPPEMEAMPVDTYTPEEQANAEKEQLPDSEMEDNYMDFVLDESLQADEQEYLMNALEADPKLNSIIDKVIMTASEFSGAGEVEGPGTGVSDSIPARLSDGEFVITEKATDQIGADNLQRMMDDAERMADGGEARYGYQMGGMLSNPLAMQQQEDEEELLRDPMQQTEDEINKSMMQANRMPSLMGAYR